MNVLPMLSSRLLFVQRPQTSKPAVEQMELSNPRTLTLPRHIHDDIIDHARQGKPEEVCGLLRGKQGATTGILRTENVAPDPIMDYEVEPSALLVQFDWEDAGDELIGIYHSHPVSPAYPSASDAFNAYYPDSVYLICSLQDDEHPVLNGYFLKPLPGPINLDALRKELDFVETRPGRWGAYLPAHMAIPPALALMNPPPGLTLYVVYETDDDGGDVGRVVSVEMVVLEISSMPPSN